MGSPTVGRVLAISAVVLVLAVFSGGTPPAQAFKLDDNVAGYTCIDNNEANGQPTYKWDDITDGISIPGMANATSVQVPIPFEFNFFGNAYSQVYVCDDGFLQFGAVGDTGIANARIATNDPPNNIIAGFWENLNPTGGTVKYKTLGPDGSRRFVVSWINVKSFRNNTISFQIELLETNGATGILIQYQSLGAEDGLQCTVGIEDSDGIKGVQYDYQGDPNGALSNGLAVGFYGLGGVPPWPVPSPLPPTNLVQSDELATGPELSGYIDDDRSVSFKADVSHEDTLKSVVLQVEIKPVNYGYDGGGAPVPLVQGAVVPGVGGNSGGTANSIPNGNYKWRARTKDAAGIGASQWVEFEAFTTNFVIPGPVAPTSLIQSDSIGSAAKSLGYSDDDGDVAFRATVADTDVAKNVQLQVEIKPLGSSFNGVGDPIPLVLGNLVIGGNGSSECIATELPAGSYKWRARTIEQGAESLSWVSVDASDRSRPIKFDNSSAADFVIAAGGGGGQNVNTATNVGQGSSCGAGIPVGGAGSLIWALLGVLALVALLALRRR